MTTKGASWSQFWAERHLKAAKSFRFFERSKKCKLSRWNPPTVTILYAPRDPKMRFDPSVDAH